MNNPFRYWRLCAWSGPVLLVITIIFWGILGHNIPPFAANLTAQEFAAQFGASAVQIRTGMAVEIAFSPLYLVWGLAITKVMETIEALPKDVSILFIEHDMDLVFRFAERITVLVAGSILCEGTPDEIASHPEVQRVYLGGVI